MAGISAAPVARPAPRARASSGLLAEEVDLDAAAGDVAVGRQADDLPARSRWASTPNRLSPPLAGSTSMPRPSRNATNRSYSDSGLSRSITVVNDPAPRR